MFLFEQLNNYAAEFVEPYRFLHTEISQWMNMIILELVSAEQFNRGISNMALEHFVQEKAESAAKSPEHLQRAGEEARLAMLTGCQSKKVAETQRGGNSEMMPGLELIGSPCDKENSVRANEHQQVTVMAENAPKPGTKPVRQEIQRPPSDITVNQDGTVSFGIKKSAPVEK